MQLLDAEKIVAPTLVVYGYQDYEPITQAYLIRERIPQTRIRFLNRCGHMTWIEQPEGTFEAVDSFLTEGSAGW
jgi:pimeloyl-ACP methyl ester carboxylesterase